MKTENGGKKRVLPWMIAMAVCLALISSCVVSTIMAKYISTAGTDGNARVASFVFDSLKNVANYTWSLDGTIDDDTDATMELTAKNFTGTDTESHGKVSSVKQKYDMEIMVDGDLPIEIIVEQEKKDPESEAVKYELIDSFKTKGTDGKIAKFVEKKIENVGAMEANKAQADQYRLTAKWIDGEPFVDGEAEIITVKLRAQQITAPQSAELTTEPPAGS